MYNRTKNRKKSKQVEVNGKLWDKEKLKDLLMKNDKAVMRALLLLYSFQTDEEQYSSMTSIKNNKGFNMWDAEILTPLAKQVKEGIGLSNKQLYVARAKILKYVGQIFRYMQAKNNLESQNEVCYTKIVKS